MARFLALPLVVAVTGCAATPPAQRTTPPPVQAPKKLELPVSSVAVLPIRAKGQADQSILEVLDDLLLTSLTTTAGDALQVVGKSDLDAILGFEKAKDALGCDDVSCASDLAGALGVESIISATAGTLGPKYVLTLVWISQRDASAFGRHTEKLGSSTETFDVGVERAVASLLGAEPAVDSPPPAAQQPQPMLVQQMGGQVAGGGACACLPWAAVPFSISGRCSTGPECARVFGLVGNQCADPDGSGYPWCYVSVGCGSARWSADGLRKWRACP